MILRCLMSPTPLHFICETLSLSFSISFSLSALFIHTCLVWYFAGKHRSSICSLKDMQGSKQQHLTWNHFFRSAFKSHREGKYMYSGNSCRWNRISLYYGHHNKREKERETVVSLLVSCLTFDASFDFLLSFVPNLTSSQSWLLVLPSDTRENMAAHDSYRDSLSCFSSFFSFLPLVLLLLVFLDEASVRVEIFSQAKSQSFNQTSNQED